MIGADETRSDTPGKMDGRTRYTGDMRYEGMLHGATVRAPLAHGRLRAIRRDEGAVDWSRVTFATAEQIPGNRMVQMIAADMPFLAWDEVLYRGEPVALVAAPTVEEAEAARRAVTVEMDPLPATLTLDELVARHRDPARRGELHELARWNIQHGDAAGAVAGADVVLERLYTTPHQEQAYLETNAMIAVPEPDGRMRVEGSMQCPYYVAPAVAGMLGTDLDRLHVLALPMGGAFGGKEDYPSLLGGHAALLARLSGRPVRMLLQRAEDVAYTTKRHPAWMRLRGGVTRDGGLAGIEIDIVFDGGAYITMSPVVLSRGAIHAAGPYAWPAVQIDAVAYRTHTPPNGAFRGFGVPQVAFAIECFVDELAHAAGIEPHEFRLRNRLRPGDRTATSQVLDHTVASREVLEQALARTDFAARRAEPDGDGAVARGVGMSLFWHGAGFTGGGEARIAAEVALDLADDGRAHIRVSSTDMGQGAHTVLPQIAAESLGVPTDHVVVDPVDTAQVPDSGPTVASRTTMIVGGELALAAADARAFLLAEVAAERGLEAEQLRLERGQVLAGEQPLGSFAELVPRVLSRRGEQRRAFLRRHQLAPQLRWDEASHRGDAYATFAWGCCVAEVELDLRLYEVRVPRLTMVVDVGRAVNPTLARGQVEGGAMQALGYALSEEVGVTPEGSLLRDRFQTYIVPTTLDAPQIDVVLVEVPYGRGPGGAKGLGEMPMNGAAPAVANALHNALGARVRDLPLSPERIFAAVRGLEATDD